MGRRIEAAESQAWLDEEEEESETTMVEDYDHADDELASEAPTRFVTSP